jgi:lysophospholipase L1-like esterase
LSAGELLVRLVEPRADTPGIALPGSNRLYGYPADFHGLAGGIPFQTNAAGFRGPELESIDTAEDFVILVLGDSYAFGYGVAAEQAFPSLLEVRLRAEYPTRHVHVVNLGIPGYDTSQELAVLKEWGPRLRPRLVLLEYHLNDIKRPLASPDSLRSASQRWVWRVLASAKGHLHLLRFLLPRLAAFARLVHWDLRTTATAEVGEYVHNGAAWRRNQVVLREIFSTARRGGAEPAVLVVPYVVQLNDRHGPAPAYQAVLRFCADVGIASVDAFDYFKGHDASKLWINAFDGHPNALGHALMADAAHELVSRLGRLDSP